VSASLLRALVRHTRKNTHSRSTTATTKGQHRQISNSRTAKPSATLASKESPRAARRAKDNRAKDTHPRATLRRNGGHSGAQHRRKNGQRNTAAIRKNAADSALADTAGSFLATRGPPLCCIMCGEHVMRRRGDLQQAKDPSRTSHFPVLLLFVLVAKRTKKLSRNRNFVLWGPPRHSIRRTKEEQSHLR